MTELITRQSLGKILEQFHGRKILVTGYNGFVGSWLTLMLARAGAEVVGVSLAPEPGGLAESLGLSSLATSIEADITEPAAIDAIITEHRPEIVFHLAAQALVLPSYEDPVRTWSTNVMGTANVLDTLRRVRCAKACLVITSDKCYATADHAHIETDALGGDDPYSASKAGAEMVAHSYRYAFFDDGAMALATARAGNIVGGGDWADYRIVPDCVRAIRRGEAVELRHPEAVRPWQHVLDAVAGYLRLMSALLDDPIGYSSAWNFGPPYEAATTVGEFVSAFVASWRTFSAAEIHDPLIAREAPAPERSFLTLDSTKAHTQLGWQQLLDLHATVDMTVEWYASVIQAQQDGSRRVTEAQIDDYLAIDAAQSSPASERSTAKAVR